MKAGDIVKLTTDTSVDFEVAVISTSLSDVPNGFKLDRKLGDFRCWNKDDLTLVASYERN